MQVDTAPTGTDSNMTTTNATTQDEHLLLDAIDRYRDLVAARWLGLTDDRQLLADRVTLESRLIGYLADHPEAGDTLLKSLLW